MHSGTTKVILVSNRLPLTVSPANGDENRRCELRPAVGYIANAIDSLKDNGEYLWVGYPGTECDEKLCPQIDDLLREKGTVTVHLSEAEYVSCHNGFCKDTLWPHLHGFPVYCEQQYNDKQWQAYCAINQRYAQAIAKLVRSTGCRTIWIHGYQFLPLPAILRQEIGCDLRIGYFLHAPFPSYEIFRILPWRQRLLKCILEADLIGVQSNEYLHHLLGSVDHILGESHLEGNLIYYRGHTVTAGVFPMCIDYEQVALVAETSEPGVLDRLKRQRERKIILATCRMDFAKGIPKLVEVYGRLLDNYPEYRERVVLLLITVDTKDFAELKEQVCTLIGSINSKYSTFGWEPIKYIDQILPRETILRIFAEADICMVTPLRDGMSLVCKEYLAAKNRTGDGVLILSEFAGAAEELTDALLVNPHDVHNVVDQLKYALEMSLEERVKHMRKLQSKQSMQSVDLWANRFLHQLTDSSNLNFLSRSLLHDQTWHKALQSQFEQSSHLVLALGRCSLWRYGTGMYTCPKALWRAIVRVSTIKPTILLSYEDTDTMDEWFPEGESSESDSLVVYAESGLYSRERGGHWSCTPNRPVDDQWKDIVRPIFDEAVKSAPSTLVLERKISFYWDYNRLGRTEGRLKANEVFCRLSILSGKYDFTVHNALCMLQVTKNVDINVSLNGCTAFVICDELSKDVIRALTEKLVDEVIKVCPFRVYNTKQVAIIDLPGLLGTFHASSRQNSVSDA